MKWLSRNWIAVVPVVGLASAVLAQSEAGRHWDDSTLSRLEVLSLLESLNANLLSHDSATLVLEQWCGDHHIAMPAHIVAARDEAAQKAPSAEQRERLGISATEPVNYRSVKLLCGTHVLSEAENWYVPSRLTDAMNHALETTNISFGRAVADLHFQRHTLSAGLLWSPLPEHWESGSAVAGGGGAPLTIPDHVLQHHAILTRADGMPFSEVVETYTGQILDFPPPTLK